MREAVDYAVQRMKQEGFLIDPVVTRRTFGYVIEYIVNEVAENRPVLISGLGTFGLRKNSSKTFFSGILQKEVTTVPKAKFRFTASKRLEEKLREKIDENK